MSTHGSTTGHAAEATSFDWLVNVVLPLVLPPAGLVVGMIWMRQGGGKRSAGKLGVILSLVVVLLLVVIYLLGTPAAGGGALA